MIPQPQVNRYSMQSVFFNQIQRQLHIVILPPPRFTTVDKVYCRPRCKPF